MGWDWGVGGCKGKRLGEEDGMGWDGVGKDGEMGWNGLGWEWDGKGQRG